MRKTTRKICACCMILILVICLLTSCQTKGLPKLEKTEEGILFQGHIYVSVRTVLISPFRYITSENAVGWLRSIKGHRAPIYTTGTDEDCLMLYGYTGIGGLPSLWLREDFVFPTVKECYIEEMELYVRENDTHYTIGPFEKQSFLMGDFIDDKSVVKLPEDAKYFGDIDCVLEGYDDFVLTSMSVYTCGEDIYIELHYEQYSRKYYLMTAAFASLIKEAMLDENQAET